MAERWSLHHGDCLAWLRTLPDESVDAVVTDPPAGIAFMGKAWDHHKGGRAEWVAWLASVMRECLRVLKPGGHALVWSLPRTEHWTACAVEDAGFEIRDGVYHLCAQGWPKSLDVSKAIDAAAGAKREAVGRTIYCDGRTRDTRVGIGCRSADPARDTRTLTAPATDDAKRWQGWGSALKPAVERWILARKPLDGTIAENVLAHGVGALNVDGCRVEVTYAPVFGGATGHSYGAKNKVLTEPHPLGRWPSNLVLSHAETCADECDAACPVAELDRTTEDLRNTGVINPTHGGNVRNVYSRSERKREISLEIANRGDSGGASRFFPVFHPFGYFSKAKTATQRGGRGNAHPTVKNVELMRWLVRLITPRGGIVLDAFGGSGTTGVAALLEGCQFTAAEQDADSYATACARLEAAERGALVVTSTASEPANDNRSTDDPRQLSLLEVSRG